MIVNAGDAGAANISGIAVFLDPGHSGVYDSSMTRQVPTGRGGMKDCETSGTATNHGYPEHSVNWEVVERIPASLNDAQARPAVLLATAMRDSLESSGLNLDHYPAVLVDLGNMKNGDEAAQMESPDGRARYAGAVVHGPPRGTALPVRRVDSRWPVPDRRHVTPENSAIPPAPVPGTTTRGHPDGAGCRHRRSRPASRRNGWRIAAIAALATVTLVGGVIVGGHLSSHRTPPPATALSQDTAHGPIATAAPPPPESDTMGAPASPGTALAADFAQFEKGLHAVAGIAISAVGAGQVPITLGDWQSGPAWSTIKVPLTIAALRATDPPTVTDAMTLAITESDNAAAESIWEGLGDPVTAAHDVEAVLRPTGDPTTIQSQRVRPEYTAFGQTDWSLTNQLRFISAAVCDSANARIFAMMGRVEPDQSWGIGTIPGTRFKGGWGPSPAGAYLVRQMGVLGTPNGMIAVAMAAQPDSGTFNDGTADLTEMANWLTGHLANLPTGQCAP